jgi:hypothetical protein
LRVTFLAAAVAPSNSFPNDRLAGLKDTTFLIEPEPVPDRVSPCGLPDAESEIVRAPEIDPVTVGENVIETVQDPFGGKGFPVLHEVEDTA